MIKTKPRVLQPNWHVPNNIHALVTTCSEDFNLALHVNDEPERVMQNRNIINSITPNPPLWLNQTHSTTVIDWSKRSYQLVDADAAITTKSQQVCVVMTADCLPILLTNIKGEFVAAIHAGWRGLNDGIISNTITSLNNFATQDMLAFIGPAICSDCFEIGHEVYETFINKNAADTKFFVQSAVNEQKFFADLRGIAQQRLEELGLLPRNIFNSQICTKCLDEWFFSYRGNPHTGRFATLIWMD